MFVPIVGAFLAVNVASIALTRCRILRLERRVNLLENMSLATATAPPMPSAPPIQTVYYPPLQQQYRVATAPPAAAFMHI